LTGLPQMRGRSAQTRGDTRWRRRYRAGMAKSSGDHLAGALFRLVIVEESDVIRAAIAELAADLHGWQVVGLCSAPAEGAELAAREKPQLVLLRAALASADIVRQIRAGAPDCMVYLTSFRCTRTRVSDARLQGADGCLEIERLASELPRLVGLK